MLNCVCACGTERIVSKDSITRGRSLSCGCFNREQSLKKNTKHSMCGSAEYAIWSQMKYRCSTPTADGWDDYGGRGVKVCDRWNEFVNFITDMGSRPSDKHSLERRDNNGDYEPDNCYWATRKQQARNKRNNRLLTVDDKTQTLAAWAEESGIAYLTIFYRLKRGWSGKDAVSTPVENK
jgi:hypothetical protein